MRVLVAPDCFTGTMSSAEAAQAIALGWQRRCPSDVIDLAPLSDGGPGFIAALQVSVPNPRVEVMSVTGPRGDAVSAELLVSEYSVAVQNTPTITVFIESAQANGLHLIPRERRDPRLSTTAGVADLLRAAVDVGAHRVVVGLGGSGTNDAGAGFLHRLGGIDAARELVASIELLVATDVDVPLLGPRGATRGFAPQKFAYPERVLDIELDQMEQAQRAFAESIGRGPDGRDASVALGAGAAGGLGFALLAMGGRRVPGIDTVIDAVGLPGRVTLADLVVTGEGALDWQSLRGKVVTGVASLALAQGRPAIALAGRVDVGRRELTAAGLAAAFSVVDHCGSAERALAEPQARLADLAERAAGTWGGL